MRTSRVLKSTWHRSVRYSGNVRELANAMEYAWIMSGGQPITPLHLPGEMRNPVVSRHREAPVAYAPGSPGGPAPRSPFDPPPTVAFPTPAALAGGTKTLSDVEMEYILQVYAKNNHNKQVTATELGISLKTLYNKLHKYEEELRSRAG